MPNPGCGGIGMVIEFPDHMLKDNTEISEGYLKSTNNRMELLATIRAFEWLQANRDRSYSRVIIITDSLYVYSNHQNASYWKKDGWLSKSGRPYENSDLWDAFLKERQKLALSLSIEWEKGKTKEILKRVDALAKSGAKHPTKTDTGFQSGKHTSTRTKSKAGATLFPANNQETKIRVYRKSIYGKNEKEQYKVTFDKFSEETNEFIEKYVAYANKNCVYMKRNCCYLAKFNDDPTYPLILEATPIDYVTKKKA